MAQTKCNCKNCRRLIGIDTPVCPFCGTPNTFYNTEALPKPNSKSASELSIEEMESLYREPIPVKTDISSNTDTISDNEMPKAQNNESDETISPVQNAKTISATQESHRSKIPWDDTPEQDTYNTYAEMFDEQGKYQANYDGYYNDTLPKIKDEIDKTLAGKEKTILKVFFSLMGIIAIIIYLVLTN